MCGGVFHVPLILRFLKCLDVDICVYSSIPRRYFDIGDNLSELPNVRFRFRPKFFQAFMKLTGVRLPEIFITIDEFLFDIFCALTCRSADVIYGWSGHCLFVAWRHRKAIKSGDMTFIIDRACPHVCYQNMVLKKEYARVGMVFPIKKLLRRKMVAEYAIADFIVCPSSYSTRSFDRFAYSFKTVTLPLTGKLPKTQSSFRKSTGSSFVVGVIGGNAIRKGFVDVFRAAELLEDEASDVRFLLRTNESAVQSVPAISSILALKNVEIIPRVERVEDFYHQIDCLLLPSVDEGFGMVVLEALAHGLPVIISENVGARDFVVEGKNGFIVPVNDPKRIQECVKLLRLGEGIDEGSLGPCIASDSVPNDFFERYVVNRWVSFFSSLR